MSHWTLDTGAMTMQNTVLHCTVLYCTAMYAFRCSNVRHWTLDAKLRLTMLEYWTSQSVAFCNIVYISHVSLISLTRQIIKNLIHHGRMATKLQLIIVQHFLLFIALH